MAQHKTETRCPICGKPAVPRWRPFCSRRCGDVDLFRWLGGSYRFPGEATGDSDREDDSTDSE